MPELRSGRAEAAAVIWDWRGEQEQRAPAESRRGRIRLRGALQALAAAAVGTLVLLFLSRIVATVVFTIAGLIFVASLLSPTGLYAAIERGFQALGRLTGRAMTWILMPLMFYLFFLPFGLLFRRGRRDPMKRFYESEASTYWSSRDQGRTGSAARDKQF